MLATEAVMVTAVELLKTLNGKFWLYSRGSKEALGQVLCEVYSGGH